MAPDGAGAGPPRDADDDTLDLRGAGLGDAGALALAGEIARRPSLRALRVGSNGLGAQGVAALCEALRDAGALWELSLGDEPGAPGVANALGDAGALHAAALVRAHPTLRALDLRGCGVGEAGARALLDALEHNRSLVTLRLDAAVPPALRGALMARLCRNANAPGARRPAIVAGLALSSRVAPEPAPTFTGEQLDACTSVLRALAHRGPAALAGHPELRALLLRVARAERRARQPAAERARPAPPDARALLARTGIRRRRAEALAAVPPALEPQERPALEPGTATEPPGAATSLPRARRCYACKERFDALHAFYDSLCPACAGFHFARRRQSADLRGRVALVTGARVGIGHEVALKLLRAGARVLGTTRFPRDAARRFARAEDFAAFADRLELFGLDLRDLRAVESLCDALDATRDRLDVLVNNAAQTVHRPDAAYAPLHAREALAAEDGPSVRALVRAPAAAQGLAVHAAPSAPEIARLFPPGTDDGRGLSLDLRDTNGWRLRLGEVPTVALLEAQVVNAVAPFVLVNRLRALLRRSPAPARFVVNVSAVEGQFYRAYKPAAHPHTNMAKAALNMLTRTAAEDLARDGIYMNSVDPGWVSNQNPHGVAQAMDDRGFAPPLDDVDAAARVCDPVFSAVNGAEPAWGCFLKDYRPAPW